MADFAVIFELEHFLIADGDGGGGRRFEEYQDGQEDDGEVDKPGPPVVCLNEETPVGRRLQVTSGLGNETIKSGYYLVDIIQERTCNKQPEEFASFMRK